MSASWRSAPVTKGGKLPGALKTRTDFGAPGYGGPCPPEGDHPHRYLFTVFAVRTDKLDVTADTSPAVIGFNLHFNDAGQGGDHGAVQAMSSSKPTGIVSDLRRLPDAQVSHS